LESVVAIFKLASGIKLISSLHTADSLVVDQDPIATKLPAQTRKLYLEILPGSVRCALLARRAKQIAKTEREGAYFLSR
jgi:hypothetical protein